MPQIPRHPHFDTELEQHLQDLPTKLASKTDLFDCLHFAQFTAGIARWNLAEFRAYLKRADELVMMRGPQDQVENIRRIARWVKCFEKAVEETTRFLEEWAESDEREGQL